MYTQLGIDDERNTKTSARALLELAALPGVFFEARLTTLSFGSTSSSSLYLVTEALGEPLEGIVQLPQPVADCAAALPKMLFTPLFVREVATPVLRQAIARASERVARARKSGS